MNYHEDGDETTPVDEDDDIDYYEEIGTLTERVRSQFDKNIDDWTENETRTPDKTLFEKELNDLKDGLQEQKDLFEKVDKIIQNVHEKCVNKFREKFKAETKNLSDKILQLVNEHNKQKESGYREMKYRHEYDMLKLRHFYEEEIGALKDLIHNLSQKPLDSIVEEDPDFDVAEDRPELHIVTDYHDQKTEKINTKTSTTTSSNSANNDTTTTIPALIVISDIEDSDQDNDDVDGNANWFNESASASRNRSDKNDPSLMVERLRADFDLERERYNGKISELSKEIIRQDNYIRNFDTEIAALQKQNYEAISNIEMSYQNRIMHLEDELERKNKMANCDLNDNDDFLNTTVDILTNSAVDYAKDLETERRQFENIMRKEKNENELIVNELKLEKSLLQEEINKLKIDQQQNDELQKKLLQDMQRQQDTNNIVGSESNFLSISSDHSTCNKINKDLTKEVDLLKRINSEKDESLSKLQNSLENLSTLLNQTEKQLEDQKKSFDHEIFCFKSKIEKLQTTLDGKSKQLEEIKQLQIDERQLKEDRHQLDKEFIKLSTDFDNRLAELSKENNKLKTKLNEKSNNISQKDTQINHLNKEFQSHVRNLNDEIEQLKIQLDEKDVELEKYDELLTNKQKLLDMASEKISLVENSQGEIEETFISKIDLFKSEISMLKQELEKRQHDEEEDDETISLLEERLKASAIEIKQLKDAKTDKEATINTLKTEIDDKDTEFNNLKYEYNLLVDELDEKDETHKSLMTDLIDQHNIEMKKQEEKLQLNKQENIDSIKQIKDIDKRQSSNDENDDDEDIIAYKMAADKENFNLLTELKQAQFELESMDKQNTLINDKYNQANERILELEELVSGLNKLIESKECQLDDLRKEIDETFKEKCILIKDIDAIKNNLNLKISENIDNNTVIKGLKMELEMCQIDRGKLEEDNRILREQHDSFAIAMKAKLEEDVRIQKEEHADEMTAVDVKDNMDETENDLKKRLEDAVNIRKQCEEKIELLTKQLNESEKEKIELIKTNENHMISENEKTSEMDRLRHELEILKNNIEDSYDDEFSKQESNTHSVDSENEEIPENIETEEGELTHDKSKYNRLLDQLNETVLNIVSNENIINKVLSQARKNVGSNLRFMDIDKHSFLNEENLDLSTRLGESFIVNRTTDLGPEVEQIVEESITNLSTAINRIVSVYNDIETGFLQQIHLLHDATEENINLKKRVDSSETYIKQIEEERESLLIKLSENEQIILENDKRLIEIEEYYQNSQIKNDELTHELNIVKNELEKFQNDRLNFDEERKHFLLQKEILEKGSTDEEKVMSSTGDIGLLDAYNRLASEKRDKEKEFEISRAQMENRIHELEAIGDEIQKFNDEFVNKKNKEVEEANQKCELQGKQIQATAKFLQDQSIERELERDDFQKEINRLADENKSLGMKNIGNSGKEGLQTEIRDLDAELSKANSIINKLKTELSNSKKETQLALDNLKEQHEMQRHLEEELDVLSKRENDQNEKIKLLETELINMRNERNKMISDLQLTELKIEAKYNENQNRMIQELQDVVETAKRSEKNAQKDLKEIEEELKESRNNEKVLIADKKALHLQLLETNNALSEVKGQVDELRIGFIDRDRLTEEVKYLREELRNERETLSIKNYEIEQLETKHNDLTNNLIEKNNQFKSILAKKELSFKETIDNHQELLDKVDQLEKDNDELQRQLKLLQETPTISESRQLLLEEKNDEIDELRAQIQDLKLTAKKDSPDQTVLTNLMEEIEIKNSHIENQSSEINILKKTISDIKKENEELSQQLMELDTLEKELKNAKVKIGDLNNELTSSENELKACRFQVTDTNRQLDSFNQQFQSMQLELNERQEKIIFLEKQCENVGKNSDFAEKLKFIQDENLAREEEFIEAKNQLKIVEQKLIDKQDEIDELQESFQNIVDKLKEKQSKINDLEEQLQISEAECDNNEKMVTKMKIELDDKQSELNEITKQFDNFKDDIAYNDNENEKYTSLRLDYEKIIDINKKFQIENDELKLKYNDIENLNKKLLKCESNNNELTKELDILHKKLNDFEKLEISIKAYAESNEKMALEIVNYKEKEEIFNNDKNDLSDALEKAISELELAQNNLKLKDSNLKDLREQLAVCKVSTMGGSGDAINVQEIQGQLLHFREQNNNLKNKLELTEKQMKAMQVKNNSELENMEEDLRDANAQLVVMRAKEHRLLNIEKEKFEIEERIRIVQAELDESKIEISLLQTTPHSIDSNEFTKDLQRELNETKLEYEQKMGKARTKIRELESIINNLNEKALKEKEITKDLSAEVHQTVALDDRFEKYLQFDSESETEEVPNDELDERLKIVLNKLMSHSVKILTISEVEFLSKQSTDSVVDNIRSFEDSFFNHNNNDNRVENNIEKNDVVDLSQNTSKDDKTNDCKECHKLIVSIENFELLLKDMLNSNETQKDWRREVIFAIYDIFVKERNILKSDLSGYKKTIDVANLERRVNDLASSHERALDQFHSADRMSLLEKIKTLSATLEQYEDEDNEYNKKEDEMCREISHLKRQIKLSEYKIEQERGEMEHLRSTIDEECAKARQANSQLYQVQSELSDTKQQLSTCKIEMQEMQTALNIEQSRVVTATKSLDSEKRHVSELMSNLDIEKKNSERIQRDTQKDIERLNMDLKNIHQELDFVNKQRLDCQKELDHQLNVTQILRNDIDTEKQKLNFDIQKLKTQLGEARNIIEDLRNELSNCEKALVKEKSIVNQLKTATGSTKQFSNRDQNMISDLKIALDAEKRKCHHLETILNEERKNVLNTTKRQIRSLAFKSERSPDPGVRNIAKDLMDILQEIQTIESNVHDLGQNGSSTDDGDVSLIEANEAAMRLVRELKEEVSKLKLAVNDKEAELQRFKRKYKSLNVTDRERQHYEDQITDLRNQLENAGGLTSSTSSSAVLKLRQRMHDIQGRFLKAESLRKSLVYQKKYLLLLLGGYQETEEETLKMLAMMGARPDPKSVSNKRISARHRFRSAVCAVCVIWRLKFYVKHRRRVYKNGGHGNSSFSGYGRTPELGVLTVSNRYENVEIEHTDVEYRSSTSSTISSIVQDNDMQDYMNRLIQLQRKLQHSQPR